MATNQIKQKKTKENVKKLIEGFKNDFTIEECVSYAGISRQTYYNWINEDEELLYKIESAKTFVGQLAKKHIIKSINMGNISDCKWYLERRQKKLYGNKDLKLELGNNFSLLDLHSKTNNK